MKKSNLYTKFGDEGKTALASGETVFKNDLRVKAYGAVDELSALIGVLGSDLKNDREIQLFLEGIQSDLFIIGSILSCAPEKREGFKIPKLSYERVTLLEMSIDECDSLVPKLKNFILPGGENSAATAHYTRTVARRAERECVTLSLEESGYVPDVVLVYINRVSDYFFALARLLNHQKNVPEKRWP